MLIVDISPDADEDIERLFNYIAFEVMNENAAFAYRTGIIETAWHTYTASYQGN